MSERLALAAPRRSHLRFFACRRRVNGASLPGASRRFRASARCALFNAVAAENKSLHGESATTAPVPAALPDIRVSVAALPPAGITASAPAIDSIMERALRNYLAVSQQPAVPAPHGDAPPPPTYTEAIAQQKLPPIPAAPAPAPREGMRVPHAKACAACSRAMCEKAA